MEQSYAGIEDNGGIVSAAETPRAGITQWLIEWTGGDKGALDRLTPLVYSELRHMASRLLRTQRPGNSVHATTLVHEAYLRLVEQDGVVWQNRAHFFGIAARCMRQILVDRARARDAAKRGGRLQRIELDDVVVESGGHAPAIMDLDLALKELAELDARKSWIVELRYFGGMTSREIATVVGVSDATVSRELRVAQAWLHRQLST